MTVKEPLNGEDLFLCTLIAVAAICTIFCVLTEQWPLLGCCAIALLMTYALIELAIDRGDWKPTKIKIQTIERSADTRMVRIASSRHIIARNTRVKVFNGDRLIAILPRGADTEIPVPSESGELRFQINGFKPTVYDVSNAEREKIFVTLGEWFDPKLSQMSFETVVKTVPASQFPDEPELEEAIRKADEDLIAKDTGFVYSAITGSLIIAGMIWKYLE